MAPQEGLEPTTLRLTAEEQYKKHARTIRMRKARANEKRGVSVIGCAPLFCFIRVYLCDTFKKRHFICHMDYISIYETFHFTNIPY